MPRNAGLGLVDFRGNARVLEISCPFLGVTKIEKRVRKLLAPPPTPATLCTTPAYGPNREPKETKPVSRRTITARRVAALTPVQSHGPPQKCDKFTYQMRSSTRHRNPNLQHNLLRQKQKLETQMLHHASCCPSTPPYLHPAAPARRTLVIASVTAPTARSCSTTTACPCDEARCSGVCPSCGAWQRSIRQTPQTCAAPLSRPRPSALPNLER